MRINGMEGTGTQPVSSGAGRQEDAYSKSLKNQIENAQKKLQDLASNAEMPPEEKMKKRQELMKEISSLQNQLRQHEIDLRRQAQEQQKQEREERQAESPAGRRQAEQKGGNAGLSGKSMQAFISADSSMKQAEVHGSVRTELKGRAGVLEGEIKQDQIRGLDTSAKEEELANTERRAAEQAGAQTDILAKAGRQLQEAAGEDPENASDKKSVKDSSAEKTSEENVQAAASKAGNGQKGVSESDSGGNNDEEKRAKEDKEEKEKGAKVIAETGLPAGYVPVDLRL